jgi:sialic acid synthase SpsE
MYSVYTTSLMSHDEESEPDRSQVEFFSRFVFGEGDYRELKKAAGDLGLVFFSSAFDIQSVDLLEQLGVSLYKVASSEVTNHILLRRIAATGKPVIMSTGIATEEEIGMACALLRKGGTSDLALLHCVSLYPLPPEKANLSRIASLREKFAVEVGFSDHTRDGRTAEIAAALGARIFEKHFTLSFDFDCPDSAVSMPPEEFSLMRKTIEEVIMLSGDGHISYDFSEKDVAKSARRSLFSRSFLPKGKVLEAADIAAKRPGVGLPVYSMDEIVGKKCTRDIAGDHVLRREYFK